MCVCVCVCVCVDFELYEVAINTYELRKVVWVLWVEEELKDKGRE